MALTGPSQARMGLVCGMYTCLIGPNQARIGPVYKYVHLLDWTQYCTTGLTRSSLRYAHLLDWTQSGMNGSSLRVCTLAWLDPILHDWTQSHSSIYNILESSTGSSGVKLFFFIQVAKNDSKNPIKSRNVTRKTTFLSSKTTIPTFYCYFTIWKNSTSIRTLKFT